MRSSRELSPNNLIGIGKIKEKENISLAFMMLKILKSKNKGDLIYCPNPNIVRVKGSTINLLRQPHRLRLRLTN
jgi:hypothetical protein